MPTYEYACTKCDKVFELFQSIKDAPKRFMATQCAQCNNRAPVKRMISSGAAVIFKGSGFYQTDYRSKSYHEAAKKESESVKGEGKSESKTDGAKTDGAKIDGAKTDGTKAESKKTAGKEPKAAKSTSKKSRK